MEDEHLWNQIMELTPLKRWATAQEIAEWIYFVGVTNRFMTGQSLLIDGGEAGRTQFIWPNRKRARWKAVGRVFDASIFSRGRAS